MPMRLSIPELHSCSITIMTNAAFISWRGTSTFTAKDSSRADFWSSHPATRLQSRRYRPLGSSFSAANRSTVRVMFGGTSSQARASGSSKPSRIGRAAGSRRFQAEDVDAALGPGQFGMAEETGRGLNEAITAGVANGQGIGQAVAAHLAALAPPFAHLSLLCASARLGVPVTVHVAVGTDVIHMHPSASGAAIGAGSLRDFRCFTSFVSALAGGVFLNCGSAVLLPEVFLKAVALARNAGVSLDGLTTVNLDFIRLYRPETNVVRRPVSGIGKGYSIVGHHEILIPLLAAAIQETAAR
jgi:hypothetical protein